MFNFGQCFFASAFFSDNLIFPRYTSVNDGVVNRIGRKWKRSDSSDSDSVVLMTPFTTPSFNFDLVVSNLTTTTATSPFKGGRLVCRLTIKSYFHNVSYVTIYSCKVAYVVVRLPTLVNSIECFENRISNALG